MPTRNRWHLIHKAVESVIDQTYKNWELIIIDDGSDRCDYRPGELEWFSDNRIKLICGTKLQHYPEEAFYHWLVGPSNALNQGLEYATGSWIARLDDDDKWYPDMLTRMMGTAKFYDYEFVSAFAVGPRGIIPAYTDLKNTLVGSVQTWLYRNYKGCFRYNLDSWRKSWDKNNEIDLYKRMYKAGMRFGFTTSVVCEIEPRPGNDDIGLKAYLKEHK